MRVTSLEAHIAGAAVRLVTSGVPTVEGSTMAERQQSFEQHSADLALRLTREPRGHAGMVGVILTPPERPEADAGMVFFDGAGPRAHSGHAAMAAAALALEHGLATTTRRWLEIDTVGGACRLEAVAGAPGTPWRVRYEGPPAAVLRANLPVASTRRNLAADLAWSGTELVAIVEGESAAVPLSTAHTVELRRAGTALIDAIDGLVALTPPGRSSPVPVTACVFVGPAVSLDADLRSVLVRAGGSVSRSPSASGSAAGAVVLAAMHAIAPGAPSRHESLSGACWTAIAGDPSADGTVPVAITGEVYPTGTSQWADAASDPLSRGVPWT
jgi:proline racemase